MNLSESPQRSVAGRLAMLCLSSLPVVAPASGATLALARGFLASRPPVVETSVPYLRAIGSPALRFQSAPAPVAVAPVTRVPPARDADAPDVVTFEPAPATSPALAGAASGEKSAGVPTEKVTPPILPDEIRATVRPEDFLPYFQIPGSARRADDVTLLVPVPRVPNAQGSLPSSSATYTQTPK